MRYTHWQWKKRTNNINSGEFRDCTGGIIAHFERDNPTLIEWVSASIPFPDSLKDYVPLFFNIYKKTKVSKWEYVDGDINLTFIAPQNVALIQLMHLITRWADNNTGAILYELKNNPNWLNETLSSPEKFANTVRRKTPHSQYMYSFIDAYLHKNYKTWTGVGYKLSKIPFEFNYVFAELMEKK